MQNQKRIIISRIIQYEFDYFSRKFKPWEIFIFLLYLIVAIVTGLGDTISFFTGENSSIPTEWKLLKSPQIVTIISILILVISVILSGIPVLLSRKQTRQDTVELLETIRLNIVPAISNYLEELSADIKQKFNLKGNIRVSLWIPVRQKLFTWNIQMVCKTSNISDKELEAIFELDEGVIGYTYLKAKRKYALEFIDISNPQKLPSSYVALSRDNELLINPNIKIVLAVAALQESSILGLLAVDTDDIADLNLMSDRNLHSSILDWITEYSNVVKLLWRMKNNV
jgi:hypothetical protein